MTQQFVPVTGTTQNGTKVWYTGRAGEGFISTDPKEAFLGYTLQGAQRKADFLNRMTPLHGVEFVAAAVAAAVEAYQAQHQAATCRHCLRTVRTNDGWLATHREPESLAICAGSGTYMEVR